MSKYAEYDARAEEADRRITQLSTRVEAMATENAALKKKVAQLEKQVAGMKNAGGKKEKAEKAPKEKKEKKEKAPKKKGGDKKKAVDPDAEKKLFKAALKEGGKKGQDICGLNEMGGVSYFHIAVDNAFGRWDLIEEVMKGFNTPVDPAGEDRKGGAAHLGKCLLSAADDKLIIYINVPKTEFTEAASGQDWLDVMLPVLGKGAKILETKGDFIKAEAPADTDNNLFPLKMRDSAINMGFDMLKKKKLVIDQGSDEDIDYGELASAAGWDEDY